MKDKVSLFEDIICKTAQEKGVTSIAEYTSNIRKCKMCGTSIEDRHKLTEYCSQKCKLEKYKKETEQKA